jgi:ABC-type glutathione transport system ATPase component
MFSEILFYKRQEEQYNDGKADERIVKILNEIKLDAKRLQKKFASVLSGE